MKLHIDDSKLHIDDSKLHIDDSRLRFSWGLRVVGADLAAQASRTARFTKFSISGILKWL